MNKPIIVSLSGLLVVSAIFFLGRTVENKSPQPSPVASGNKSFDIFQYTEKEKSNNPGLAWKVFDSLTKSAIAAPPANKILVYNELSRISKDSLNNPLLYVHYLSEAAKLDNSGKSLTFAAQLSLTLLRSEHESARADWLAALSQDLFERALKQDPQNDELKVGLGSVFIFGKGRGGDPAETMKGITHLLEVARRDSNNMSAQLMLGIGGFVSGQHDKAEKRLLKVIDSDPGNLEAAAFLADNYAAWGKKEEAIKWYNISKRIANDAQYSKEADERIRVLRQSGK